ncbi:MAG: hypothetical protein UW30_C0011G0017 [Candidatus Giovannonibacteria bacterium GW2011_GWA2_44_13b]|uniref:Uncharacterized protein n=1 Tax=Candidatus Giovannonibacteria bacterium GW2011_GWA2_44_13b TaxID=1618647 RepID=A0A0G1H1E6_9BACT|nr:MAG: hypothetical protein UW30_C0011G0017 [Candidatus Giovannonibacteria bacterium GW2011_GWA2_44_13b]
MERERTYRHRFAYPGYDAIENSWETKTARLKSRAVFCVALVLHEIPDVCLRAERINECLRLCAEFLVL